jgi:DNA-binding NtrC family response regulator
MKESERKQTGHLPLIEADRLEVDPQRFPDVADLAARLRFSPNDGRIWLDDQRMLLIHSSSMGLLRRELIESLGVNRARGLLTRMGYHAGTRDAQMARKVRPQFNLGDMFSVGPQLHALEGGAQVETIKLEMDVERGVYHGEFIWKSSCEDEEHSRYFGIAAEPRCWMQIGYASGFTTAFMGRPVLYREVECQSMGQPHCRIVGKPVDDWADAAEDLRFLQAESFTEGIAPHPFVETPKSARQGASASASDADDEHLVGASAGFNSVCHMIQRVAATSATVLFLGESGVGKEVFARALHRTSGRRDQAFIAVNCAAIPEQLVESELFGVERGAYTGAGQSRLGRFERAHGGTLFLDEVGTLSMSAQGKLLRALQEGEVERLGDHQTRKVDVRVIAATNVDLRSDVKAGRFREDLFYRLNVFPIRIPPLRERREDTPILMNYFLERFSRRHGRSLPGFTTRAIDAMLAYNWPGNVRELENVIERGVILGTEGQPIDVSHIFTSGENVYPSQYGVGRDGVLAAEDRLRQAAARNTDRQDVRVTRRVCDLLLDGAKSEEDTGVSLDEIESVLLKKAVQRANGNLSAAARLLGITRPQLVYRLKTRGLSNDDA